MTEPAPPVRPFRERLFPLAASVLALGFFAASAGAGEDLSAAVRGLVTKSSGALIGKAVFIDMLGQTVRAKFLSAGDDGIVVEALGQEMPVPWDRLGPKRLLRLGLKAASSLDDFILLARFARSEGLDEEAGKVLDEASSRFPSETRRVREVRSGLFPEKKKENPLLKVFSAPKTKPAAEPPPRITSKALPKSVSTFHCISLYWSPAKGGKGRRVFVKYRKAGEPRWRDGLPMKYNPVPSKECKADYRGSLVNLSPGTLYEIALFLEGTDEKTAFRAATWSEDFPVGSVVRCKSRDTTLEITGSGRPGAYVLYDGTGSVIDLRNEGDVGIMVNADYVIVRGFTIRNTRAHGVRIGANHHVVIENCDISKWGSPDETGFGKDYQAGIYSNKSGLRAVVVQRNRIHHPNTDSNSWAEKHRTYHPSGPQGIVFWESEGNHVIRYNEIWSDEDHYYNDILGAGRNGSFRGFPGPDSDIYGNYLANCWDDAVEAEGGGQNVRIWNNYMEHFLMAVANAACSIGPLYVWRNVSGYSYTPPGSQWDMSYGYFCKMGFADSEKWMTGHMYFFNNTVFQPEGKGAGGLGGSSKLIKHCVTRNNVLHSRNSYSISVNRGGEDNDFDWDLLSGRYPPGQEKHGVSGVPRYVPGAGFDFETKTGVFQLAPGSRGYDAGTVIPNFCDFYTGNAPDMGAHEAGTPPMVFGVKAEFFPPGFRPPDRSPQGERASTGGEKAPVPGP